MDILEVEGIGQGFADKLGSAGIATVDDLLERGARPSGRAAIAEATGISAKLILEWVNQVDLMRISGVGSQYADLLSQAGVDSPLELARRSPTNLARTFAEIDAARPNEVRRVPSEQTVAGWVEQAKTLQRAVFHEDGPGSAATAEQAAPPAPVAAEARQAPAEVPAAGAAAAPDAPATVVAPATDVAAPYQAPVAEVSGVDPAPAAATAPTPRPLAPVAPTAKAGLGLWARIKHALRMD